MQVAHWRRHHDRRGVDVSDRSALLDAALLARCRGYHFRELHHHWRHRKVERQRLAGGDLNRLLLFFVADAEDTDCVAASRDVTNGVTAVLCRGRE